MSSFHQLPPVSLEDSLPQNLPQPKFQLGMTIRWREAPNPDFGRVVGVLYAQESTHQITGLHYLILLDEHSPSRSLCLHDFAFEDDLEHCEPREQLLC